MTLERKSNEDSDANPNRSELTRNHQQIVDDLHRQIQRLETQSISDDKKNEEKRAQQSFNELIRQKYKIVKYNLSNRNGEPVEVWIYDKDSKPYPVLEDLADKRVESLLAAAEYLFEKQGRWTNPDVEVKDRILLKLLKDKCREKLIELLSAEKPLPFDELREEIKKLIKQLRNDLAYIWQINHPHHAAGFNDADYQSFNQELWEAVEQVTPAYKKANILTINRDPKVRTVQYVERGTQYSGIQKESSKIYPSAHKRDEAYISNFSVTSSGYLDGSETDSALHLTTSDFSHASLPPIAYYQREKKEARKNYYHPLCVEITKKNIQALEYEMRTRIKPNDVHKTSTMNMIMVGLLTVTDDKDKQKRIYEEMILAAECARAENPHLNLMTFNFGVNLGAVRKLGVYTYPAQQKFENQRAFFNLHFKLMSSMKVVLDDKVNNTGPANSAMEYIQNLFTHYKEIGQLFQNNIKFIESKISESAKAYKHALDHFLTIKNPTDADRKNLEKLEHALARVKKECWNEMNAFFNSYVQAYKEKQKEITELGLELEKLQHSEETDPALRNAIYALVDFKEILYLYCENHWNEQTHNFQLQSRIGDLADQLAIIDSTYETGELSASSYYCKSRNDRSAVNAAHKDLIRAQRDLPDVQLDRAAHYPSCATNQITGLDTCAGSKFGQHWYDPVGHTNPDYGEKLESTSGLATHKLAGKKFKYSPNKTQLLDSSDLDSTLNTDHSLKDQLENLLRQIFTAEYKDQTKAFLDYLQSSIHAPDKESYLSTIIRAYYRYKNNIDEAFVTTFKTFLTEVNKLHSKPKAGFPDEKHLTYASDCNLKDLQDDLIKRISEKQADVKTLDSFKKAIHKKNFDPKLFKVNYQSKLTQKVLQAYQAWEQVNADNSTLWEQIDALTALNQALNNWLIKHPPEKERNTQDWRSDSRLPGMLALQKHVKDSLSQKQKELYQAFNQGTLKAPPSEADKLGQKAQEITQILTSI